MANDKTELMKKADALRRDLSELDAQIAKLPSQPESVKPKVYIQRGHVSSWSVKEGGFHVLLQFQTEEQAEKAKAILEKMEFGEMPEDCDEISYLGERGNWHPWGSMRRGHQALEALWRHGALRKA